MKTKFPRKTYFICFLGSLMFAALVSVCYVDIALCPYDRSGGNPMMEKTPPQRSIFDRNFHVFPCHMIDLVVWVYIICLVIFGTHKWLSYRRLGFHYFFLDYCYFHNFAFTAFLLWLLVSFRKTEDSASYFPWHLDISPAGIALANLTPELRQIACVLFFVFLTGSYGPILCAIVIWKNQLLLHDSDKVTSCFLHFAPPTVQALILHNAFVSTRYREVSTLRTGIQQMAEYKLLIQAHIVLFIVWQVCYHSFTKVRTIQRKRRALKLLSTSTGDPTFRVTAYTWLMEQPPMGKKGPLYKFVTVFGSGELPTKIMFVVLQFLLHMGFVTAAYPPIYASVILFYDAWPMLAYVVFFLLFAVWSAANLMKRWIKKLKVTPPEEIADSDSD